LIVPRTVDVIGSYFRGLLDLWDSHLQGWTRPPSSWPPHVP
jgi:hypothetical protein